MSVDVQRSKVARIAKTYVDMGLSVIPLRDDKRPAIESWSEFQERQASLTEIENWQAKNIGIVTGAVSGLIVVDCESSADAAWFWHNRGKANTVVKTPRGFHFYFQTPGCHVPNAQRVEGKYDIRGDGGYVVAPPSVVKNHEYEFREQYGFPMRPVLELVKFDMAWRYPPGTGPQPREAKKITDGIKYIRTMQAVAGQGGHNTTWKAAQRLKDSGMCESEALAALFDWNQTNCDPPWSTAELLHKVKGVYGGAN